MLPASAGTRNTAPGILVAMLTPLVPAGIAFDPLDDAGRARLLELYAPPTRDWVRCNFVSSVTGSAEGGDGTSESLTSRLDRRLLGVIREQADLVLVGAQSVRAEGYRTPRTSALAIVTSSGRLDGHRIGDDPDPERVLVLCPAAAQAAVAESLPGAGIVVIPDRDGRLAPSELLAAVRARGHRSIVCEGGPSLASQLVTAGLVDELCLSTAPVLTASTLPTLGDTPFAAVPVRLERLLIDEQSTLYARWVRASQSPMAAS